MDKTYQTPRTTQWEICTATQLYATSWEIQDGDGDKEDDFGIIEGDPEGGLSSKPRWSLWD